MEKIKTSDLYYSAYLMSNGVRLDRIRVETHGKRKVQFEFMCPGIGKLADEYISGEAVVNVKDLKSSLKHLKDIIFEEMRAGVPH